MNKLYKLIVLLILGTLFIIFQNCGGDVYFSAPAELSSETPPVEINPIPPPIEVEPTPPPITPEPQPPIPEPPIVEQPVGPFRWTNPAWNTCNRVCGEGLQKRTISCFDQGLGKNVGSEFCNPNTRPIAERNCFIDNTNCTKWISSVSDFKNINRNDSYICLRKDINLNNVTIDSSFNNNLTNQVFNGCGQSLSKASIRRQSLFGMAQNSEIINLVVDDPSIEIYIPNNIRTTETIYVGGLLSFAQGVKFKNIEMNFKRIGLIQTTGPEANYCGAMLGSGRNLEFDNIKITGDSFTIKCMYSGGLAGYVRSDDKIVKMSNIDFSIKNLRYHGSFTENSSANLGGIVGYIDRDPQGTTQLTNINVSSKIHLQGSLTMAGGIIGYFFHQTSSSGNPSPHTTSINNINFSGDFITHRSYYANFANPSIGGLIANSSANDNYSISNSSFTGKVRLFEINPSANSEIRRTQGKVLNIRSGIGFVGGVWGVQNRNHVNLINFRSNSELILHVDDILTETKALGLTNYVWRINN